jgi:RNA polymerase sigma factor (sigma-70 family)
MEEFPDDSSLAKACLSGHESAWRLLRESYWERLRAILCARGASSADAEDLLSDLWPELGGFVPGREALLSRYKATGPLSAWLATVAIHRLANKRRKASPDVVSISQVRTEPGCPESTTQEVDRPLLAEAMVDALRNAWETVSPTARLMLLLVHIHGVTQREIAALWGWNESKVSRSLDAAMQEVSRHAVAGMNQENPGLMIEWSDFLMLSEHSRDLFLWGVQAPAQAA